MLLLGFGKGLRTDVDVTKANGLPRSTITGSLRAIPEHKSATQIVIARRYNMATRIKKSYSGQELRAGASLLIPFSTTVQDPQY